MTSHYTTLRPRPLSALVFAAMAALSCAGGDVRPAADSAANGPAASSGEAAPDSDVARESAFAGTTGASTGGTGRAATATLRAVRTSPPSAAAVERVVFEFDGDSVPRYEIAYAEPPFMQCGSGRPVAVAGGAVLQVRLRGTHAHAESGGEMLATVTERDRKLDQPLLRQLTLTCDFEGEVEWLLGVAVRTPYRILELQAPARLVVDLAGG